MCRRTGRNGIYIWNNNSKEIRQQERTNSSRWKKSRPRLNESFHLATAKVEFGTGQRGKQRGIPKWKGKGQFQTKDPVSRGKLPGVQVSSPEGLCPPKAAFFLFSLSLPLTFRFIARARSQGSKSLVSPTARVKGESQDYVQPGVTCQRSPSRRKGE